MCQTLQGALYLDLSQLLFIGAVSTPTLQGRKWRLREVETLAHGHKA